MKNYTFLIFFLSIILLTNIGHSCDCIKSSIDSAYIKNDIVFVGKVIDGKLIFKLEQLGRKYYDRIFTLEIIDILKGNLPDTIIVKTGFNSAICGFDFIIGQKYLVYCLDKNNLWVSLCSRTKSFFYEGEKEIQYIREKFKVH